MLRRLPKKTLAANGWKKQKYNFKGKSTSHQRRQHPAIAALMLHSVYNASHTCEEELRDETGQYIKLSVIANTAQLLQISLQFADLLTDSNVALRYSMVYIYS